MSIRVTRAGAGVPFQPADDHHAVTPQRLHGREAGATDHLVVTRSEFAPGASVDSGPVAGETVYFLLAGQLTIQADGAETTLGPGDAAYLPDRAVRALRAGDAPATVLVARST